MKDYLALAGCIVMVTGVALFSVPLAVIAAGGMMVCVAVLLAFVNAKRGPDERGEH